MRIQHLWDGYFLAIETSGEDDDDIPLFKASLVRDGTSHNIYHQFDLVTSSSHLS